MNVVAIGMVSTNGALFRSADLHDYARWEYGRDADAWLASVARRSRADRRRRTSFRARVGSWLRASRSLQATTAVSEVENRGR